MKDWGDIVFNASFAIVVTVGLIILFAANLVIGILATSLLLFLLK